MPLIEWFNRIKSKLKDSLYRYKWKYGVKD